MNAACAVFDRQRGVLGLVYTGSIEKGTLLTALRGRVAEILLPRAILRTDALPLTNNGKTDRKAAAALLF